MSKQIDLDSLDGILPLPGSSKPTAAEVTRQATVPVEVAPRAEAAPSEVTSQVSAPPAENQLTIRVERPVQEVERPLREEERALETAVVPNPVPSAQSSRRWPWVILGAAVVGALAVVLAIRSGGGTEKPTTVATPAAQSPSPLPTAPDAVSLAAPAPMVAAKNQAPEPVQAIEPEPLPAAENEKPLAADNNAAEPEPPVQPAVAVAKGVSLQPQGQMVFPASFMHDEVDPASIDEAAVSEVKRWLAACRGLVTVVGHTSSVGSNEANYHVGLGRALAVRRYLLGRLGVHRRIRVESRGSSEPVAPNVRADGRTANRRVVLMCQ